MKRILVVIAAMLLTTSAWAQEVPEALVSWDVEFFAQGVDPVTGSPVSPAINFLKSAAQCGQPKVLPSGNVVNPTQIRIPDPDDETKDCVLGPNASGVLMAVPIGVAYRATLRSRGATKVSARSVASNPFDRALIALPPPVPGAPRVIR